MNNEQFFKDMVESYRTSVYEEMAKGAKRHNALMTIVRAAHNLNTEQDINPFKRLIIETLQSLL
jgi:hypothetical protein